MNRNFLTTTTLLIGLAATAQGQFDMIGCDLSGDLYDVDSTMSQAPVLIGPSGFTGVHCMARTPSGTIYMIGGTNLLEVDAATGNVTDLGATGITLARGMAASSDATLHVVRNANPDELYSFDIASMTPTLIGPTNFNTLGGLSFGPGGILYAMDSGFGGQGLITLDLATGAGTDVNPGLGAGDAHQFLAWDGSDSKIYAGNNVLNGWMVSIDPTTAAETFVGTFNFNVRGCDFTGLGGPGPIGQSFECPTTVPNSSGNPGVLSATGSDVAADNDVTLTATQLPNNQFGFFLNSPNQNVAGFNPPGSQGNLCIGLQAIGRYNQPNSIFNTMGSGTGELVLDLPNTPTPTGNVAVVSGQTWYFTCWFRDSNPNSTSNFTDAICVTFQ